MDRIIMHKEVKAKIHELEGKLIFTEDVLRWHVLVLEDLQKMFGIIPEDLMNDPHGIFHGPDKIQCKTCGKFVSAKRQICSNCLCCLDTCNQIAS